jgi:signal transduction histidine kinase
VVRQLQSPGIEREPVSDALVLASTELAAASTGAQVVERVVRSAPNVVSAAEHVSVTVRAASGLVTAGASGELPREVDALQYQLGEGPCVHASSTGEMVLVGDVIDETRWPQFASRMAQQGQVRSMLALPLRVEGEVAGSLNLYSAEARAFRGTMCTRGKLFATVAALALTAADEREQAAVRVTRRHESDAALSRDLRSGVTVALAAAQVLRRRRTQLDHRGQQALDLLTEELAGQQRLLVDLLDPARDTSNRPVSMVDLLPVLLAALRRSGQSIDLQIRSGVADAVVTVPPVRLSRIVDVLLANADERGGASAVEVGRTESHVWIAFEDRCGGVPADQRAEVFARFHTASTSSAQARSPLVSTLSRHHAPSLGADLVVEVRHGGGARFVLRMPMCGQRPD